jgi:hypothetical protein
MFVVFLYSRPGQVAMMKQEPLGKNIFKTTTLNHSDDEIKRI